MALGTDLSLETGRSHFKGLYYTYRFLVPPAIIEAPVFDVAREIFKRNESICRAGGGGGGAEGEGSCSLGFVRYLG